jgi:TPR repeat protein
MTRNLYLAIGAMWAACATAEEPGGAFAHGIAEYETGHYAQAVRYFRQAADAGDARAPEILALMYRFGHRLYGDQLQEDATEAARWAKVAAERRFDDVRTLPDAATTSR